VIFDRMRFGVFFSLIGEAIEIVGHLPSPFLLLQRAKLGEVSIPLCALSQAGGFGGLSSVRRQGRAQIQVKLVSSARSALIRINSPEGSKTE